MQCRREGSHVYVESLEHTLRVESRRRKRINEIGEVAQVVCYAKSCFPKVRLHAASLSSPPLPVPLSHVLYKSERQACAPAQRLLPVALPAAAYPFFRLCFDNIQYSCLAPYS